MYDVKIVLQVLATLNFLFIIFGTIGNLCTFVLLMRPNIRKHSCMRYLATLCIFDMLCLYTWNFSLVYQVLFTGKKIEFEGAIQCRLFAFYSYFILQSSSWIICWIGMDRIITLLCKSSTSKTSKLAKNNKLVTSVILFIFFCFNFIVVINNAKPFDEEAFMSARNITRAPSQPKRTYSCYEPTEFYAIWDKVHITMYSLLPFAIILCENIAISYLTFKNAKKINSKHMSINPTLGPLTITEAIEQTSIQQDFSLSLSQKFKQRFDKSQRVYRKRVNIHESERTTPMTASTASVKDKVLLNHARRSKKMNSKRSQVANLLLFLTVSFFCTTLPYSTYYALQINFVYPDQAIKHIAVGVLTLLQYARHSANFLIYLFTSSIIRAEIKQIYRNFKCKKSAT
jgi:hypothetical protein